jgi:septation ring formation regulator EzrA
MVAKANLAKNLAQCLREISDLLEKAKAQAQLEQRALVANDPETLVATCRAQEEILQRIVELDKLAGDIASALSDEGNLVDVVMGEEKMSALSGVPEPYASLINTEIARIRDLAQQLQEQHDINRTLIQNGLEIVACCLRTIASDTGANYYSPDGYATEVPFPVVLSVDRKV